MPGLRFSLIFALFPGVAFAQQVEGNEPAQLPEVVVEGQAPVEEQAPEAKPKSKKKAVVTAPKAAKSKPAATPSPAPVVNADANAGADADTSANSGQSAIVETGTSPVRDYVATKTTTGIKTDTPLREIPQSITVVGQEQIRDQGAQNIQDALRYVPGVVADGLGIDSRTDNIIIRGTQAAEFLDGMRRTLGSYTDTYKIEPYFMERIEVLRGPASILYGQAPVGGIVNSISKRPLDEARREITVEYGSFDFKQTKADFTGPLTDDGKWSYRVVALARDSETQVDFTDDDRVGLAPALTYRPVLGTSITVLGQFQKSETGTTQLFLPVIGSRFPSDYGRIPFNRFVSEPGIEKYNTDVASGTLLIDHKFNDAFRFRHSSRYSDVQVDYDTIYVDFFTVDDPSDRLVTRNVYFADYDTSIFNTDTNLEAKFATGALDHKVLFGFDSINSRYQTVWQFTTDNSLFDLYAPVYGQADFVLPDPTVDPLHRVSQTGLYVQDQLRLGDWIGVVGARRDNLRDDIGGEVQEDQATTYRAGLMYELDFGLTPYVSYAESFVPLIGRKFGGGFFEPQEGEMSEAGFKYQAPGTSLVINSAIYDLTESNRLATDLAHPDFQIQTGAVNVRGFEIEAAGRLTSELKIIASYSYTDARYEGGDKKGFQVESVPEHLAAFWAVYDFHTPALDGWSIGGGVRYVGTSLDGLDEIKTPAVGLFDAMIAYENDEWRWSLNGTNLTNEEYLSTCIGGISGTCYNGTLRTITTGLTYKF